MRKITYFVMALALVLGLAQCKKEQIEPQNQGEKVSITLNVENGNSNGSRANVDPPHVNFVSGDRILVAYDGKYVGYLEHNGSNFSGTIDATGDNTKPLYFYFLGNKADVSSLTEGSSTTCTVIISDQANYPHLPVISMAPSNETFNGSGTYTAHLLNKCSLMEFDVTSSSTAAICITGMNNKVTVNFDPSTAGTDEGFSYSKDTEVGFMKLSGKDGDGKTYAIVLPQTELTTTGEAYTIDGYEGTRPALPALGTDEYYKSYTITMSGTQTAWDGDLSKLTNSSTEAFATARNGMTVYGTLDANVKVSIADGATVTLDGATINGTNNDSYTWAGINCLGDANIILSGSNTVKGFYQKYPGVHVPSDKTLTISGSGSLNASSNGQGAGIGGGHGIGCGNIVIKSGVIYATGGTGAAGIGSGYYADNTACGNITIENGTVEATGGQYAAGIGCGVSNYCGNILIKNGSVIAQGGDDGAGIGAGAAYYTYLYSISVVSTCGTITIEGGTVNATGGQYGAGIGSGISVGGENSKSTCGNITITGGTVTATGGTNDAAGIGTGYGEYDTNIHEDYNVSKCGDIEITGGDVTAVTRSNNSTTAAIGKANYGICTKVTIRSTITRVEMTKVQAQSTETLSAFVNATDLYFNDYNCTSFLGMDFYNGRSIEIGAVNMRFSRSGNTLTVTPIP